MCHYSTSMEEDYFLEAGQFKPDRWIRKDIADRVENFGSIPFGHGIRSCVGRRIAELEMYLAVTRVCLNLLLFLILVHYQFLFVAQQEEQSTVNKGMHLFFGLKDGENQL